MDKTCKTKKNHKTNQEHLGNTVGDRSSAHEKRRKTRARESTEDTLMISLRAQTNGKYTNKHDGDPKNNVPTHIIAVALTARIIVELASELGNTAIPAVSSTMSSKEQYQWKCSAQFETIRVTICKQTGQHQQHTCSPTCDTVFRYTSMLKSTLTGF